MNRKQVSRVLQVLLLATFLLVQQTHRAQAKGEQLLSATEQKELAVIQSTIQISTTITIEQPDGQNGNKLFQVTDYGLGSMIKKNGEASIFTHNHWGRALQDNSRVEFRAADDRLLVSMSGAEFKQLIQYQDLGTLVLKAPDILLPYVLKGAGTGASLALLTPGSEGDSSQVKPGEVVQVAFRQPNHFEQAAVIEAEVVSLGSNKGVPTYDLRSLSGQPIVPGDSGGGVWYNGKLVGIIWGAVLKEKVNSDGNVQYLTTDRSFAAIIG